MQVQWSEMFENMVSRNFLGPYDDVRCLAGLDLWRCQDDPEGAARTAPGFDARPQPWNLCGAPLIGWHDTGY